ncbi:MAG: hypothetical protein K6F35_10840 [Lachnospiraceae bacterium]|nr:hypothetical protein [Lachnospiraceae bacterium]
MEELAKALNQIEDTYYDFVTAMLHYAGKKQERADALLGYITSNPGVKSAEVIRFVSEQPDFFEDAAYMKIG